MADDAFIIECSDISFKALKLYNSFEQTIFDASQLDSNEMTA